MNKWLSLITTLPTENATLRQRAWRALKASGAAVLRDGVYLMPERESCRATLEGLASEVRDGGGSAHVLRVEEPDDANFAALQAWVDRTPWIGNLAADPAVRSNTSVCLKIVDPQIAALDEAAQRDFVKKLTKLLETEGAALDIGGYRDAPPGLRVWCGSTVDTADVEALLPWLDWAFATAKA